MARHGVAMIGLGVMGRRMLGQMAAHGGFLPVAAFDPSPEARAQALREHPSLPLVEDVAQAIRRLDVDLVYIATPPATHRELAALALDAGKSVFCEKPLSVSLADGEAMAALAARPGMRAAVNYVFATSPAVLELARRLRAPDFRPRAVSVRMRFHRWPREWQMDAAGWLAGAGQGGPVREVLSHYVYLLRLLFGDATLQASRLVRGEEGACETHAQALLDCAGVPVTMSATVGGAATDEVVAEFHGEAATLALRDWFRLETLQEGAWQPVPGVARDAAGRAQLSQVSAMLEGARHVLPDFACALAVQRVIERMLHFPGQAS